MPCAWESNRWSGVHLRAHGIRQMSTPPHAPLSGKGKGKVFPYSLPSVGPGADPGVQAVSPQVT